MVDDRLALDVASLIMAKFMDRADVMASVNKPVTGESLDVETEWTRLSKEMIALNEAKQTLFSRLQEDLVLERDKSSTNTRMMKNHLSDLVMLMAELKEALAEFRPSSNIGVEELHRECKNLEGIVFEKELSIIDHSTNAEQNKAQLMSKIEAQEETVQDLTAKLGEKEEFIRSLEEKDVSLKKEFKDQLVSLLEDLKEMKMEPLDTSLPTVDLSTHKTEIVSVVAELEENLNSTLDLNNELRLELDSKLQIISSLESRMAELNTKMTEKEMENQKHVMDLIDENELIVKTINVANDAQISELKDRLSDMESKHVAEKAALEKRILELEEQVRKLEKEDPCPSSPQSKRSRTGSVITASIRHPIDASSIRVVFTGYRDQTGPRSVKHLGGLVEKLGGVVHIRDVFSEHVLNHHLSFYIVG